MIPKNLAELSWYPQHCAFVASLHGVWPHGVEPVVSPLRVKIVGAIMDDSDLTDAILVGANFAGANFKGAWLVDVNFFGANMAGANFTDAVADRVDFTEALLARANFTNAILASANFDCADLRGANFTGANVYNANFDGADITGATGLPAAIVAAAWRPPYDKRTPEEKALQLEEAVAALEGRWIKLPFTPIVKWLDQEVLEKINKKARGLSLFIWEGGSPQMRADLIVQLGGEDGRILKRHLGTEQAASLIYAASCPGMSIPDFQLPWGDAVRDITWRIEIWRKDPSNNPHLRKTPWELAREFALWSIYGTSADNRDVPFEERELPRRRPLPDFIPRGGPG